MSETRHSPEPWTEDDGNVFSEPLQAQRIDAIMRRLNGEGGSHPDEGLNGEPLGFVAAAGQNRENFEADALRIVAAVNSVAGIPTAALESGALAKALDALVICEASGSCGEYGRHVFEALRALGRLP
jgi:hypothetical protein